MIKDISVLERLFKNLKAIDGLDILCRVFNAANAIVVVDHRRFSLYELYDDVFLYQDTLVGEFEIRFYGGPPKGGSWFEGTLLTLLVDHALYKLAKGDEKTVSKALHMANSEYQV